MPKAVRAAQSDDASREQKFGLIARGQGCWLTPPLPSIDLSSDSSSLPWDEASPVRPLAFGAVGVQFRGAGQYDHPMPIREASVRLIGVLAVGIGAASACSSAATDSNEELMVLGAEVYVANCASCHGQDPGDRPTTVGTAPCPCRPDPGRDTRRSWPTHLVINRIRVVPARNEYRQ